MSASDTFESVRIRASEFVSEREWEKFHFPMNVLLALSGECGEVCEIFQWKKCVTNSIEQSVELTEKELINVGEEIADVFIYSTRLCDLCDIDFAQSVKNLIPDLEISSLPFSNKGKWSNLPFSSLSTLSHNNFLPIESSRHISLSIQYEVGKLCNSFRMKAENECLVGLRSWTALEIQQVSINLGTIACLLILLARQNRLDISKCISEKFLKNEAKYPVELVKGSSAKYTHYMNTIKSQNVKKNLSHQIMKLFEKISWVSLIGGFVMGILICVASKPYSFEKLF